MAPPDNRENSLMTTASACMRSFRKPTNASALAVSGQAAISAPPPEIDPLVHQIARQNHLVDFGCTIHKPRLARITINPFQRSISRIALGATQLNGGVDGFMQGLGDDDLGHRDFFSGEITGIQ